jgi:hypothetical protein
VVPDCWSGLQPRPDHHPGRTGGLIRRSERLRAPRQALRLPQTGALLFIGRPLSSPWLHRNRRSTACWGPPADRQATMWRRMMTSWRDSVPASRVPRGEQGDLAAG